MTESALILDTLQALTTVIVRRDKENLPVALLRIHFLLKVNVLLRIFAWVGIAALDRISILDPLEHSVSASAESHAL